MSPQISIRLEDGDQRALKQLAEELALGYTTLAGSFVSRAVRNPPGLRPYEAGETGGGR